MKRKNKLSLSLDSKEVSLVYPDSEERRHCLEYIFEEEELEELCNFFKQYDCVWDVDTYTGMSADAIRISFKYETPDEIVKEICEKAIEFMWEDNVDDVST